MRELLFNYVGIELFAPLLWIAFYIITFKINLKESKQNKANTFISVLFLWCINILVPMLIQVNILYQFIMVVLVGLTLGTIFKKSYVKSVGLIFLLIFGLQLIVEVPIMLLIFKYAKINVVTMTDSQKFLLILPSRVIEMFCLYLYYSKMAVRKYEEII